MLSQLRITKKRLIIIAAVVYLATAGIAYAGFTNLLDAAANGQPSRFARLISPLVPQAGEGQVEVEEGAPRTEACPLNGKYYTVAERQAWENRTPIAIIIENHPDARPQSGLSSADVMFEAVAEGGITRYMGIYYCAGQAQDVIVAPVRSVRTYFIDWASTYQRPLFAHVGGANLPGPTDALGQLSDYGWAGRNNLNQFSIGFPTFVRNYNRVQLDNGRPLATEHTMETSTERLWNYAKDRRGITTWAGQSNFTPWEFRDDADAPGNATDIAYSFWSGYRQFDVAWSFNPKIMAYEREVGGNADIDNNNGEPVAAKNVIVLFTTERGPVNELKHMIYTTIGSGQALIFRDGEVEQAQWQKTAREAPLTFTNSAGQDVELGRGLTWISVVANGTNIEY